MQTIQLSAQTRSLVGRAVRQLRAQEVIPGVLYGHEIESVSISIPRKILEQAYEKAGESTLIDLQIDAQTSVKAIIHDVQRDGLTRRIVHVDFYKVNMKEKITAEVHLVFMGEAPAVKTLGGVLLKNMTKVEVESLPADLPHELIVDISKLATFEDKITVADIQLPAGVIIKAEENQAVALVEPPRSEEELKALEGEVKADVSSVEVLTEKKDEAGEGEGAQTAGETKPEAKK